MEPSLFLAAGLALAPAVGPTAAVPVAVFPDAPQELTAWMSANGWQSKREEPKEWRLEPGALHMLSHGDSVLLGTDRGFPRPATKLKMTFRVKSTPRGTDLTKKSGDDAALRIYSTYDKGGGVFSPPNTIAYTWTEREPEGTLIKSGHFANLYYLSLGAGPTPGADWVAAERDLAVDYRRAFPKDAAVPALKGLLIKCDSNDTKTSAEAWLKSVELLP